MIIIGVSLSIKNFADHSPLQLKLSHISLTSNTSTSLSFSIQDNLDFFPADKPQTTVFCSPGFEPVKVGPISNIDKSLKPLSSFYSHH